MRTIIRRNSPLSFIIYLSIYSMNNVCHWPLPSSSPTLRLKPNTIFHIEQYKREFKIKHWSGRASHGVPLERPSERWLTRQGQIRLIADGLLVTLYSYYKMWMAALRFFLFLKFIGPIYFNAYTICISKCTTPRASYAPHYLVTNYMARI